MELLKFNGVKDHSVGVELEIQVIDKNTRELISGTSTLLKSLEGHNNFKHELFESVIEINSDPCKSIQDLKGNLKKYVSLLHEHSSKFGMKLTMAGTHPTSNWSRQTISPIPRYQELVNKIQMPVNRMLIYGLHVHVGLRSGDEAIAVKSALMNYLPYLLALSTSSPYWVKRDSGMESYRVKILETLPTTGLPFRLHNWEEFSELVYVLKKAGTIKSIREIWWDVRPHPDYGTIEIRICDAIPIFDDVIAIASLIQALVAHFAKRYRIMDEIGHLPSYIIRENKWRAARYGLDAELITDTLGNTISVQKGVEKILDEISPAIKELGTESEIKKINDIFKRGTSSNRQRKIFHETNGNWDTVIQSMIDEFEESWGLKSVSV